MSIRAVSTASAVRTRLGFDGPAANPAMLVAKAPLEVLSLDWPDELSGLLLVRARIVVVGLNRRHSAARRHFSFWHEVGHYLSVIQNSWGVDNNIVFDIKMPPLPMDRMS